MNTLTTLSAFFSSLGSPSPRRDWFAVLVLVFCIALLAVSYGVYVYAAIESGSIFGDASQHIPPVTVTREEVSAVLDIYRARQASYLAHSAIPPLVDPAK